MKLFKNLSIFAAVLVFATSCAGLGEFHDDVYEYMPWEEEYESQQWHIKVGGKSQGPYSEKALRKKLKGNQISLDTHVLNGTISEWSKIKNLPELSKRLERERDLGPLEVDRPDDFDPFS